MKSGSLGLVAGAFAALSATVSAAPQAAPVYDVIIAHGTVIDGTGAAGAPADVGIIGGRIAAVGKLARAKAAKRIDATGLYVTPGFINVHDHSTPQGLPTAVNMLTQGVTTALLNPDGWGELDIGKQMSDLAKPGLALNIGAYSGFNTIWASVVGMADQRPTEAQTARMRDIVTRNLEQGAWGVSAGLFRQGRGRHRGRQRRQDVAHELSQSRSHHAGIRLQLASRRGGDHLHRVRRRTVAGNHPHEGPGPGTG